MRVIKEIQTPACRISVFQWNGKYLIKLEQAGMEQTYKIDEWDLTDESEIEEIINEQFIKKTVERFKEMSKDLDEAMKNL